jgi:hypothetical protein
LLFDSIIKTPRLELYIISTKSDKGQLIAILTPNSINNHHKIMGEKFTFGRNEARMKNDVSFNDDSVGARQFEIQYEKSNMINSR